MWTTRSSFRGVLEQAPGATGSVRFPGLPCYASVEQRISHHSKASAAAIRSGLNGASKRHPKAARDLGRTSAGMPLKLGSKMSTTVCIADQRFFSTLTLIGGALLRPSTFNPMIRVYAGCSIIFTLILKGEVPAQNFKSINCPWRSRRGDGREQLSDRRERAERHAAPRIAAVISGAAAIVFRVLVHGISMAPSTTSRLLIASCPGPLRVHSPILSAFRFLEAWHRSLANIPQPRYALRLHLGRCFSGYNRGDELSAPLKDQAACLEVLERRNILSGYPP